MFGFGRLKKKRKKKRAARRDPRIKQLSGQDMQGLLETVTAYRAARPDTSPLAITCCGRTDGAGAQALGILSAMLWAEGTGIRYLHTPFLTMAHAIGDRQKWATRWEAFLNLGRGEAAVPRGASIVPVAEFLSDPDAGAKAGAVLAAQSFHWREFQTPDALQRLRPLLRAKYYTSRKAGLALHRTSPGALTVAVHVRRGDVILDHPRRRPFYTYDEPILKTIECVRSAIGTLDRPVVVNVFSEGPPEMFAAFAAADCRLHLDGDPFEAFHNLVSADILVQAKSSFSYIAGLISTGAVLHEHYGGYGEGTFYRHAPGWIVRDNAGAFDADELRSLLAAKSDENSTGTWYARPLRRLRRWL